MAHGRRHLIPLLAVALFAAVMSVAARGQAAAAPVVRFTVFAAQPIKELAYVPRAGVPPVKITFYPTARSQRLEYRGAMPLRFLDAATGAMVAEATIPPQIREPLLLFTPIEATTKGDAKSAGEAKASTLRYQVAVLDDSAARHAAGGLAIINLSGLALSGTVGKEEVTLRAGLNPTINAGRSAKVTLRTTANKRVYQSYAATVALTAKQRALLILFPPFYKGSLEVQSRLLIDEPGAGR